MKIFIELRKREICQEIGYFFGSYSEEGGYFCIAYEGKTTRYDSLDALLIAWHKILTADPKLAWEWREEIKYIENEIIANKLEDTV